MVNFELTEVLFFKPEPFDDYCHIVQVLPFNEFPPRTNLEPSPIPFQAEPDPVSNKDLTCTPLQLSPFSAHASKVTSLNFLLWSPPDLVVSPVSAMGRPSWTILTFRVQQVFCISKNPAAA